MKYFKKYKDKYVGYNSIGSEIGSTKGMIRKYNITKGRPDLNEIEELKAKKDFLKLNLHTILYDIIKNMESDKRNRSSYEFERTLNDYQLKYPVERELKIALTKEYEIKNHELLNSNTIYSKLMKENDIAIIEENHYDKIINTFIKNLNEIEYYIDKLHYLANFEDSIENETKEEGYITLLSEYLNEYLRSFKGIFKDPEDYNKIMELLLKKTIVKKKNDKYTMDDYSDNRKTYKAKSLLAVILVDLIDKKYIKENIDDYILTQSISKFFNLTIKPQFFGQIKNRNVNKEPYFKLLQFIPEKR